MTTDLKMLAWTAGITLLMWLPYILAHIMTAGPVRALTYKADISEMPAWAARARKAHYNAVENLVPFAALVLVAHVTAASDAATASAAIAYFWFRVAHYFLYILNVPFGRTLAFAGSWLANLCILYQILWGMPAAS